MTVEQAPPPASTVERFCSQCGKSCHPLNVPHLSKECEDCGRTIYFVRYASRGGMRFEAGEKFTIPNGSITISLDPARGKLFRPGLAILLRQLFLGDAPNSQDDIVEFVQSLDKNVLARLSNFEKLRGLDLTLEEDATKAWQILSEDKGSREWGVLLESMYCNRMLEAVGESDTRAAAWAGYTLGSIRGFNIVTEPIFEETLWRGYGAGQVVHEAAMAASMTPAEAEALKKLMPLFQRMDEATLHAWVNSGLPIGPRINVKAIDERLVCALARHQLEVFEREREDAKQAALHKREDERFAATDRFEMIKIRATWAALGVTAAGAVGTALKLGGWL